MGQISRRKEQTRADARTRDTAQYRFAHLIAQDAGHAHDALELVLCALERGESMTAERIARTRGVLTTFRANLQTARGHLATWKAALPQ